MEKNEFLTALGLGDLPPRFEAVFDEAMRGYAAEGAPYLSNAFLDGIQKEFGTFVTSFDFVRESAKRVRENEWLARYSYLVMKALEKRAENTVLSCADLPPIDPDRFGVDYEMALYFAELAFLPRMVAHDREHGAPEQIIRDTLFDVFDQTILVCKTYLGRNGFEIGRNFEWNQHYINHNIYRVGVLNFEKRAFQDESVRVLVNRRGEYCILPTENGRGVAPNGQYQGALFCEQAAFTLTYRETEDAYIGNPIDTNGVAILSQTVTLPKSEWRVAITREDDIINVHIPQSTDFTPEKVEEAYRAARIFFARCFPQFKPKAYTCFSWLMAGELPLVLKETSNILAFQRQYMRYPLKGSGRGVLCFLFRKEMATVGTITNFEDLLEETSLQRKVKARYLNREGIHEAGGIFFIGE